MCSSDALEPSLVPGGEAMQVLVSSILPLLALVQHFLLCPGPFLPQEQHLIFFLIPQRT